MCAPSLLSACDRQWGWEKGYCVLSAVALMFSSNRKRGFGFGAAASHCSFSDWQKQMSIMFISESLKRCQCHPTVSSNLCNGSGRNCQACLSSISHTSWKSRLGCHSYLIHTRPEAVWVDLVQDISEVEQQTIKLCLLTKQHKRAELKWGYSSVKGSRCSCTSRGGLHKDVLQWLNKLRQSLF